MLTVRVPVYLKCNVSKFSQARNGWISYFNPANVLFQSGICLFPSGVVKPSTSITAFVLNAPLQNVGFLIFQRWVFNFGTLGFLFVFFIRQSALQPFTRNKKSETISNTHRLTLFLRCCNYKHTSVDLIRLFCAVPATHTPRKRRNRPLMATRRQTPSEFTIPKVPHRSAALTFPPQPQPSAVPELEGRAEAVEDTFNAQNVANTLWAYATMGRAAGARVGLDEGDGGSGRSDGGHVQLAERRTPISDRWSPWSPSSGEFLGSTQVELWNAKHMSQSDRVDDSQDTGSPVSRIASASRRLHMGTSPVAGSALPKRNTLLHPPQADKPWTYRVEVVMADAGQAGPNGIRQAQRDHLPENAADPLRLDCSVHIQRAITQVCFVKVPHTTFIDNHIFTIHSIYGLHTLLM